MHRDKTVARILLILSVVHVVAAAPASAIVRQRSLDVDEDVTAASEKRGNSGNTPRGLYPVPQVDNDRPSASGIAQLDNDPPPASGAPHDSPPASGALHEPPPASGAPHDPPPASEALHDPPPAWEAPHDPPPASGAPHNPPPASGTPQLDNDPHPVSGASQLDYHPPAASETSSVHDDPPFVFDEEYRMHEVHYEEYRIHEIPYAPSSHESETPPNNNFHQSEPPLNNNRRIIFAPSSHESDTSSISNHFISGTMKNQLKHFAAYAVVGGSFFGFVYGLSKLSSDDSKPNGRDLTSSGDVVRRGVSTHPRPPRRLVSRALANLRNEDLRLLSVLTRRALERLD